MVDPIDEDAVQQMKEFEGKKLLNATKEASAFSKTKGKGGVRGGQGKVRESL
jgi:HSP90 family molecular chaperone